MARLGRTGKLFAFLRLHRHELFDESFQKELERSYRDNGAGKEPVPPGLLAMMVLLQGYRRVSDAEAVELTVVDLRWQLVLGCLGMEEPIVAQGTLFNFRQRMIAENLDRRLLERTVELARSTKAFDWRKLPKDLRVAIDSSPLEGSGRVEDTINLLAHAIRKLLACLAVIVGRSAGDIATAAGAPLFATDQSIKAALDREWSDPDQKAAAVPLLSKQIDTVLAWIREHFAEQAAKPPVSELIDAVQRLRDQNLEPDPSGGGSRIREGVAPDRQVSIQDPEMRHGRKSKSKRFNGYKRHLAADVDTKLILAATVTPANRPEEEAAPALVLDIRAYADRNKIGEIYADRGYINSAAVDETLATGGDVICKPWFANGNRKTFPKSRFVFNIRDRTITCPAGEVEHFVPGTVVEFDPEACSHCMMRSSCTMAGHDAGRTVNIGRDELLQIRLRREIATPKGRERLRKRVMIEHSLAHIGRKQGNRARYTGVRKNTFDVRRAASVVNLETVHRELSKAA
jgi:hypothetical protein